VERAARLANAHDFISAMPQGYDTVKLPCLLISKAPAPIPTVKHLP
jgi:ABC-type transport system involved in Fe-S cluster assembly fused permease/ATPase subunit